jgi:hypothetical protein
MAIAAQHNITISDLEYMTIGMLIDYLTAYSNSTIKKSDDVYATQADIDAF